MVRPEWLSVSAVSLFYVSSQCPLFTELAFSGRCGSTSRDCSALSRGNGGSHRDAVPAGANVVKNVPETAIKMGFNDRIKALVVKDGHPITLGAAISSPPPMPACLPACSTG